MAIPAKTLEDIKARVDIVAVVERYLPELKRSGRNYRARCPFHEEKTPSFFVNPEKRMYHCFGCKANGDVFKFVQEYEKISWPEAVRKVGALAGIAVRDAYEDSASAAEDRKVYAALEKTAEHYKKTLRGSYAGRNALEYLKKRSINAETIERFSIGFSQGDSLEALAKDGISSDTLVLAGVARRGENGRLFEYMSGRLVFPIRDARGRIVAFGGRSLDETRQPKYLNTPETRVYVKGRHLYGFFEGSERIKKSGEIIIVEGYVDVIASHQCGLPNAVSCLGTAFTEYHASLIGRFVKKAALLFDPDRAGMLAAVRAAEHLLNSETEFYVVTLPDKTDPDEYVLKKGAKDFVEYIRRNKKDFFDFHCEYLAASRGASTPLEKLSCLMEIFPNISKIKSPLVAQEALKSVALKMGIDIAAAAAEYALYGRENRALSSSRPYMRVSAPQKTTASAPAAKPLSGEETLISVFLSRPELAAGFDGELFADANCRALWKKIRDAFSSTGSVDASSLSEGLDPEARSWFSSLAVMDINVSVSECVERIRCELTSARLRDRLKAIEPRVIELLTKGKSDDDICKEYQDILVRLKNPRARPPSETAANTGGNSL